MATKPKTGAKKAQVKRTEGARRRTPGAARRNDARKTGTVLIASGASGGHLFPALTVAEALRNEGYRCVVVLGGGKFGNLVTDRGFELVRLPASAFNVRNPVRRVMAVARLGLGFWRALRLVMREKPRVVFGTGGYATVATILAAKMCGVPTVIHEQNVLPGRANRLLSRVADRILLTFDDSRAYLAPDGDACLLARMAVTGTPLREQVLDARKQRRTVQEPFGLMILGGSMGARILSDVVPEMLAMMKPAERAKVAVIHQSRPEDVERVRDAYAQLGLARFEVASFYANLPELYRNTHLVIGRSGTGTLLETAILGRAAVYVPHQMADNHQLLNAQVAENAGAAVVLEQPLFTPANLLVQVRGLMKNRDRLAAMEQAARTLAAPNATALVVDAVEHEMAKD